MAQTYNFVDDLCLQVQECIENSVIIATWKTILLQPTFQIQSSSLKLIDPSRSNLYMDVGSGHFCFTIFVQDTGEFVAMEYYAIKSGKKEDEFRSILTLNPLLKNGYNKVLIIYNTSESVLVPGSLYHPETHDAVLNIVHGDLAKGLTLAEKVQHLELFNVYRVPRFFHEIMSKAFPAGKFHHYYSAWLKARKTYSDVQQGDHLHVIFYPYKIIAALFHNQTLELIQNFSYDIPEDVSYHLLSITEQFRLDPERIKVHVSGLLDTNSAMYTELMKYFLNVDLEARSRNFNYDFAFDNYPQHFFTPVFSLALCE